MTPLTFPNKILRAGVIKEHMDKAGYDKAVCFTCGNAADALRLTGVDVLEIGEKGELKPGKWWKPEDIQRHWPNHFDATSGHLSVNLMEKIGARFRQHLGSNIPKEITIKAGSGETVVSMALAYPDRKITAQYGGGPETEFNWQAPLNQLVSLLCTDVVFID